MSIFNVDIKNNVMNNHSLTASLAVPFTKAVDLGNSIYQHSFVTPEVIAHIQYRKDGSSAEPLAVFCYSVECTEEFFTESIPSEELWDEGVVQRFNEKIVHATLSHLNTPVNILPGSNVWE